MELASQDGGEKGIARLLEKLTLSPDEWERFVHFGEHHYTRNLLLLRERFSIMLLCWNPGQSTPPHAHGEERQSWFKVPLKVEKSKCGFDVCSTMDIRDFLYRSLVATWR